MSPSSAPRRPVRPPSLRRRATLVVAGLAVAVAGAVGVAFAVGTQDGTDGTSAGTPSTPWPAEPPARICGGSALDEGPAKPPAGAVVVPAGNNQDIDFGRRGATYWFAPGLHTLGEGEFSQIVPGRDATYVGAPGAVLDGQRVNRYAFTGYAPGVTISYLTIQNFGPVGSNSDEGVVNHDAATGWTVEHNTIRRNAGAGLMIGSKNVVRHNCLTRNEQYGFNAYSPAGPAGILLEHNEVSHNNTYDWEARTEGCGCTGGGKFWAVTGAVVRNNYIHHNRSVGLWADNNNSGFLIEGNYISDNTDVGILYETSYNAVIRDNAIVRNAHQAGPRNPGFPTGGIYVSESGADPRVPGRYSGTFEVTGNLLEDNWSGVVLWENADRFCGSPANTSTGECTLVRPGEVTAKSCRPPDIATQPLYSDCRWKTQHVNVHDNTFRHDPAAIGPRCTFANGCGVTALMSNYGTYPDWSPYQGTVVQKAITYQQGNSFHDNTYEGRWRFLPVEQGNLKTFEQWRAAPFRQDEGSRMKRSR